MANMEAATLHGATPTKRGMWYDIKEDGTSVLLWIAEPADLVQAAIRDTGTFHEAPLLRRLRRILPAVPRIVDVGANIGNHTLWFAKLCDAREVIPFEPNPEVIPELLANLEANHCDNVNTRFLGIGVGAIDGNTMLKPARKFVSEDDRRDVQEFADFKGSMPVSRLDSVISGMVDLIRIDVDEMALPVLEGAERLISRSRPDIMLEVSLPELPGLSDWIARTEYRIASADKSFPEKLNLLMQPRAARGFHSWPARIVNRVMRRIDVSRAKRHGPAHPR